MTNHPRVSVIICTYNYAKYIVQAIESVLSQTYPKEQVEIIIVDDGSTDETKQVLKPYIIRGQVKYFFQENTGKANATRRALAACTGEYIFNLDADDYFLPGKLAESVIVYQSDPEIVHVTSPKLVFDEQTNRSTFDEIPGHYVGRPIDGKDLLLTFYEENFTFGNGSTFSARSSVLKNIEIPDATDMYIDQWLTLIVLQFGKTFVLQDPLSVWRVHQLNFSEKPGNKFMQSEKMRRKLESSSGILCSLKRGNYDPKLVRLYAIQHEIRLITHKESLDQKGFSDIFQYGKKMFFELKPSWKMMKQYKMIRWLVPTILIRIGRKLKGTA